MLTKDLFGQGVKRNSTELAVPRPKNAHCPRFFLMISDNFTVNLTAARAT